MVMDISADHSFRVVFVVGVGLDDRLILHF